MKKTRFGLVTFLFVLTMTSPAATFTVINTNSSGVGSLQQAIFDANTNAGTDVITFNIASGGLTISPTNALPSIVEPVTIDGRTQPGFVSAPLMELNGAGAGAAVDGLKINTSNCVISALTINRFLGDQIEITNGANNTVEGCYLGLNLAGLTDASTGLNGILLTNSPNNTIGGLGSTNRNFISGNNQSGVNLGGASTTNNFLLGNYIGLNVTNGAVVNSADGVRVNGPRNTIGGSAVGTRNIISGNTGQGIEITTAGIGTIVRGNYIGTDDTGAVDRGNTIDGILASAGGIIIGGTNAGEGNLISGNAGDGIEFTSVTATNNLVLGNIIGANLSATAALPNDDNGVFITTSSRSNIIGGILTGEANTIAFNGIDGISVAAAVANTNNTFRGNSIFSNGTVSGELGIDLGVSGIQVNDSGDFDTGPNQLQNFPVLAWVTNTPGGTIFSGSLNSRPSITYAIDFYANTDVDMDGAGEGKYYLGSTNLTTAADSNVTFTISLPVIALPGRYVSAAATDPFGNTSEFATNVVAVSTVVGQTFTVVNTNNSGAGSLRQAIIDANATITAGDTIAFAITNLTTTISPASGLPTIIDPVTIDGYTQPGAVVNTSASVFNAVLPVRLSGVSAGSDGLLITAGSSTVRGLMITGFSGDGIEISNLGGNTISGNVIGLDAAGVDQGNTGNGVFINGSSNNIIGGTALAARNVLSGNTSDGIEISGALAQNNQVVNNLIGTEQSGTLDRGNNGDGVYITLAGGNIVGGSSAGSRNLISGNGDNGIELSGVSAINNVVLGNIIGATYAGDFDLPNAGDGVFITTSSRSNIIGGVLPGQANQISFNTGDGINVAAATANTNNTFRGNSIYSNGNLGIDLGANGVQLNDAGDPDTGANQLQNFPVLTTVTNSATNVVISGTLNSRPSITYTLDFYSSIWVDATGVGEGQAWIGATNLATAADSNLAFTVSFAVTNLTGRYITATATDNFGNTSEFGTNVAAVSTAPGQIFTVVNTNDIGPGSLRDTIIAANLAITAGDTIVFAITNLSTTIRPASFLPAIIDSVTIDGTTQAGSVANTSSNGFNGVLPVVLDGISAGSADGLRFTIGGNTVRGLNIINFGLDGLDFSGGGGNTVAGCVIGLDAASVDRGNSGNGILLTASANNVIGGPTLATRNVISGNTSDGIEITGMASSNNIVAGNLIGTGLAGTLDRGNANGILITSAAHNRIGGTNSTERNVISGNSYGILIQTAGATNNLIVGNFLGTDASGALDLGNDNEGIYVSGVPGNILGTVGAGNLISGNGGDGIEIIGSGAATNIVRANRIGVDVTGSFAIANGNNGVLLSSAPGTTIGGATGAEGNLISGNGSDGVEISGATAAGNQVKNNLIGTTATGTAAIPNGNTGVFINSSAYDNDIGGSGNTIAFNTGNGVWVNTGTNNAIRHNLIFANGGLGIDLSTTGVTTNDVNDADTGGNQLQNFPVLSAATNSLTQVNIAGALDSAASTSYDVDFFASVNIDGSGYGEGQFYLGSTNITTDGSGHANFLASFATKLTGRYVTAMATDPNGNTSEFSPWVVAASTIAATNLIVTTTNDSGAGSLREAIQIANSFISSGADTISFTIPGSGVKTINLSNALPVITDTVLLDGYTQTGASANTLCAGSNAVLRVVLAGGLIAGNADGLTLAGSGNITVRGLVIHAFPGDGVAITSGTNHQVAGCFIGMDVTGSSNTVGNVANGIYVLGPGTSANRLGGETPADRNVISANSSTGITIENSPNNIVAGNFIGTDASGTLDRGNGSRGVLVYLSGSVSNVIGGVTGCSRNVISGNGAFTFADHYGVELYGAVGTRVLGNYIGLDVTGTQSLGNGSSGVRLRGASFNYIGDGTPAGRNIISGNTAYGVELELTSPTNVVVGNYIGTDVTGALDRGNLFSGVFVGGASYNLVLGNVISGNDSDAVYVAGNTSPGNRVLGNFIGISASGGNALGNLGAGVVIDQSSTQVGGTNVNEGNVIAFNEDDGVMMFSGDVNSPILGNSIYSNGDLGIDLNGNSVTPNDAGDSDSGANNLQNYPMLVEAIRYPSQTIVTATLNSLPNTSYRIEVFNNATNDLSGFGEGQTYLGFTNVTTDGSGNVVFAFTHPAPLTVNNYLTATTTDTNNNTSEFSGAQRIVSYDSVDLAVSIADSADPAPHATNFFYTITLTNAGPTNATSVFVTNTLPATTAYVSSTPSQGSASHSSGIVVWNVGTVLDAGSASLVVQVSSIITGQVTNTANVVSAQQDHTPANNTDAEGTFLGLTDIAVTIQDSPDPVTAGQTVTFTVTVTNAGPDVATLSTLNFSVDSDFYITGSSVSQGTVTSGVGYYYAELGNIPVGGTATLTGTAIPMITGGLASHAEAYRAETDPNFANNILVNASTTVTAGPGVFEFTVPSTIVNETGGNATLTVQRLGGSIGTVTVNYATSNLTAVAGIDFTTTTGTLTFTNGETLKTILVPINNDIAAECNETFTAHLFNPTGGAIVLRTTNIAVLIFDNEVSQSGTVLAISSTDANLPPDAGNDNSFASSVSADGRYVVFSSDAGNLVSTDFNSDRDVFVRDLLTQTTALVSRRTGSSSSGNGSSESALISGNGRYVVFSSYASIFDDDDNNSTQDVFVRDLVSATTTLISHNAAGTGSSDNASYTSEPMRTLISSNGQSIVFTSYANDLTTVADGNFDTDVFFHDLASGTNRLLSVNLTGTAAGNDVSFDPVVSADGQVVSFVSVAADLVTLPDANGGADVFVQNLVTGTNELVSVNSSGTATASGLSSAPYLSRDGRYVAFQSSGSNLAANDTNTRVDVFRRDRLSGVTTLVSVNTNGVAGNVSSTVYGISADGRYVLFSSHSFDLVPGDYNSSEDVFVRDMVANVTLLVSRAPGGSVGNLASFTPVISGDGTHVAFGSYATDLTAAIKSDGYRDVFVRNLTNNAMRLVSYRNGSTNGSNGDSYDAAISHNGNVTSFTGAPEDVIIGEGLMALSGSIEYSDVWAHTYASNVTELVSVVAPSSTGNSYSYDHQISDSGAHIVFASYAENLAPGDTNENSDVFLFNLTNGTISIVSMNSGNTGSGDGYSDVPDVSASGRYVAFYSTSTNLVAGDNNDNGDIFRRDMLAGTTALVSVNSSGSGPGSNPSFDPDITPDGRFIAFETIATNLVLNDFNGIIDDIILRDMTSNIVELITVNATGTGTANAVSYDPVISDNGRFVAYESFATNLGPVDVNSRYDVYVRDRQLGTNLLCSRNLAGTDGGSEDSYDPVISGNGQIVVFYSYATNLVTGDTNDTGDIFAFNTTTHTRQLASVALGGGVGNDDSFNPSISADGRYVAFQSYATNLVVNDSNGSISDIFVRDLVTGTTTLISGNCNGLGGGNDGSYAPSISGDGRYITFASVASDLVGGFYSAGVQNIYRHDRLTSETVLVSQNRFITGGANADSYQPRLSSNGGAIAFVSSANNLVATDANNTDDIFAWQGNLVASGVDLVLTKTSSTNNVAQSSGFTYTLTVTNYGSASATGVTVTDPLPAGVSFVSSTSSQGTATNSSGTVIATLGGLTANAGASITINVTAVTAGSVSNYANTTAIESDATPANNFDSIVVTVTSFAPPLLSIQPTNSTQIFVSWPASTPSSFLLETTTNLAPVIVWTTVTNSVSTSGTNKFVILNLNAAEPERYYRLKQ